MTDVLLNFLPCNMAYMLHMRVSFDERTNHFAIFLICNGDDRCLQNPGMGEQYILDFKGNNVFSTLCLSGVCWARIPRMMISLIRPVIERYPSLSIDPSSPVIIHNRPSSSRTMTSLVFSSFSQYPDVSLHKRKNDLFGEDIR